VASMSVAPPRCGMFLDIVNSPECTARGGHLRTSAGRPPSNFSITVGDHAAHLVGAQEER
jgi:hypothetical protein